MFAFILCSACLEYIPGTYVLSHFPFSNFTAPHNNHYYLHSICGSLNIYFEHLFSVYGYFIHMYVFVSQAQSTCEGQKRESDLLDLQTVVSHYVGIGMDPVSPKKAVSDLGL